MQGTRHGGVRHGTHKDRHIFCQTAEERHTLVIHYTLNSVHTKHMRVHRCFYKTRRNPYSESSLVSSRWVLALSACASLKYCWINVSKTAVTMYFLHARYWKQEIWHGDTTRKANLPYTTHIFLLVKQLWKFTPGLSTHLFQALFTEGTLRCVVQAALQAILTKGVATRCRHRLIEQPVSSRRCND